MTKFKNVIFTRNITYGATTTFPVVIIQSTNPEIVMEISLLPLHMGMYLLSDMEYL